MNFNPKSLQGVLKTGIPSLVNEAIRNRDIEKAMSLMKRYLEKYKIYTYPFTKNITTTEGNRLAVPMYNDKGEGACFLWSLSSPTQVETVLFTKSFNELMVSWMNGEDYVWDVKVLSKGANLVQMMKLVQSVLSGRVPMEVGSVRDEIQDAQLFESIEEKAYKVLEATDTQLATLMKKKSNIYQRLSYAKRRGNDNVEVLQQQYDEIRAQVSQMKTEIKGNVQTTLNPDKDIEKLQASFDATLDATPEERFEDMKNYINNVIEGIKPLAILCGAPGVGKTFRVMNNVKKAGKQHGIDYALIKGRLTPSALYATLFEYKDKGKLIIIDDCPDALKDDNCVDILKAAFDSSAERWVSWNTSRPVEMSAEKAEMLGVEIDPVKDKYFYPKEFVYNGGGIIITNWRAGQIDTAVRNRALICDLNFTNNEILQLVREIAPHIQPDIISTEAKEKAIKYLQGLADNGAPMEISIRSFATVAGLYMTGGSERSIQRMINEQMRLQFARGGKKY